MHNEVSRQQVFSLKHQVVRDLAWSLWGPALFIQPSPYNESAGIFPLDWPWIQKLDQDPTPLYDYLNNKNTRLLGIRFEALWHFYFDQHPSILHSYFNLQVSEEKITLGEFDVLIQDHHQHFYHIELACKFYLQWSDSLHENLWIGPNCSDRLDIKYFKTCNHQLPLLHTRQGQQVFQQAFDKLDNHNSANNIQQLAIWRGLAFQSQHWYHYLSSRFNALFHHQYAAEQDQSRWFIADKSYWLSPVALPVAFKEARDEPQALTAKAIKQRLDAHFNKSELTQLIIKLTFDETHQQWQESARYFITAPNWPYGKLSDSALTPLRPCRPPL